MEDSLIGILVGGACGIAFGFLVAKIFFMGNIRRHRKQAVKKSREVTMGYVNEKVIPLMPNFPYSYKDLTFLGKGVDYIVFDGLAEGHVEKIVFLEVKSGRSRLNKNEKLIKDAIEKGRVSYRLLRMN